MSKLTGPSISITRVKFVAVLLLLGGSFIMAATINLSKVAAMSGLPMYWLLTLAMGGASLILMALIWVQGKIRYHRSGLVIYGFIAGNLLAIYSAINFLSVAHVGASYVSLTLVLPVLFTYIPAVWFGMDKLSSPKTLAVICGTAGGVVLAASKLSLPQSDHILIWVIVATLNPLIMAFSNIYRTLYWPTGAPPLLLSAYLLMFGALTLVPVASIVEGPSAVMLLASSQTSAIYTVIMIMFFTVQYPIFLSLQHLAGPVILSMIGPIASASGALMAFAWLNEPVPRGLGLAIVLMLISVTLFQFHIKTNKVKV